MINKIILYGCSICKTRYNDSSDADTCYYKCYEENDDKKKLKKLIEEKEAIQTKINDLFKIYPLWVGEVVNFFDDIVTKED